MFTLTKTFGGMLLGPPATGPITGGFGDWYEAGGVRYQHRGVDIGVPVGTPVYAAASGQAIVHTPGDGWGDGSFGNVVIIDVPNTPWFVLTAHLNSIETRQGKLVQAGELIGFSGNSGRSTGPHVHWQVCRDQWFGTDITLSTDPLSLLTEETFDVISDADRQALYAEFDARLSARFNAFADGIGGLFRQLMASYFTDTVGDYADAEGNPLPPDPAVVAAINRIARLRTEDALQAVAPGVVAAPVAFKATGANTAEMTDPKPFDQKAIVDLSPDKPEPAL